MSLLKAPLPKSIEELEVDKVKEEAVEWQEAVGDMEGTVRCK